MKTVKMKSQSELNEELENYFSNTIIPQLFVDANLLLQKFTPPAMKQFSLKHEFIGLPIQDIKEHFRYPTLIDNIKVVIATGKILEKEIQTTDLRWYQMNILPYHIRRENRTNGVIITFVNITNRIQDLKEQEKLIAEYELLLDTIAHDIKNPILALDLTIQVLNRPGKNAEQHATLLKNMASSIIEIKKVVDEMAGAHWNKERYQSVEELLDLQNILEDVRLTLAPQIMESGAIIKQEIDVSEIKFVRRKLRSVLFNLLSNAIKYTASDLRPEIVIRTYAKDNFMVIEIADNGIGISKEDQLSIFEKFRRAKVEVEGTGVGLYLVYTVVVNAGGKVTVESEPGKGSTFKVFLKLKDT
ncbi:ATP-binding protein [Sphingobacterium alkalisoli]|uniref:histidine kinase n=1 Tax=Sphingobacterium alkalisoli TaxID=1874115 RepID=A0A4U0GWE8_9SPHI|nr:ATP-binding protein [Sphingobacterium alkalisoli]TJY63445.1 ATP-binding protein [Sphingobacterium alkalisoli]GGH26121.1 hypothetical protein GCM10011418_35140 [Sphingobacterium alkalisoli]